MHKVQFAKDRASAKKSPLIVVVLPFYAPVHIAEKCYTFSLVSHLPSLVSGIVEREIVALPFHRLQFSWIAQQKVSAQFDAN